MTTTAPETEPHTKTETAKMPVRQFVTFTFFKVSASFRALPSTQKVEIKRELSRIISTFRERMMLLPYSTVGLKASSDFLLWCISHDLADFQAFAAALNRSACAPYFDVTAQYLSMTKHSQYVSEHIHDGQEGRRLRIVPGESRYLFVYPFVKTRPWYLLSASERQRMMNEHIAIGHKYQGVKINTTYSFGLDDQEFVVAFETDSPADFLDLVQELRESESSSYTLRDTPMYTCSRATLEQILDAIG